MNHFIATLLISTIASVAGILVGAIVWGVRSQRRLGAEHGLPRRIEMRRYMLMGLYCNHEDPRPFVQRPSGRGWTINMRKEELALLFWTMVFAMLIAALMFATAPTKGPI